MRLYRITVNHWPTDDGKPWPRFVDAVMPADAQPGHRPVQPWMLPLVYEDFAGMDEFRRDDGNPMTNEPIGWVMPDPRRAAATWLSRAAALKWIDAAEQWGARAHLTESEPIRWPGDVQTYTEYAVDYGAGLTAISTDPADAEEFVQFVKGGRVVSRTITATEWQPSRRCPDPFCQYRPGHRGPCRPSWCREDHGRAACDCLPF